MRVSVRKQQDHAALMQIAACLAVLFATIIAAHTPKNNAADRQFFAKAAQSAPLNLCTLEDPDTRVAAMEQVRSEAMLRARQAYGAEGTP